MMNEHRHARVHSQSNRQSVDEQHCLSNRPFLQLSTAGKSLLSIISLHSIVIVVNRALPGQVHVLLSTLVLQPDMAFVWAGNIELSRVVRGIHNI